MPLPDEEDRPHPDRRATSLDASQLPILQAMIQAVVDVAFAKHEKREIENLERRIDEFRHELVPEGKTFPHKDYHQSLMDAAEAQKEAEQERAKMYRMAQTQIVTKGIEGVFGLLRVLVLIGLAALALKLGFKIPEWLAAIAKL